MICAQVAKNACAPANLRAYARRDLARMTARPESARMSVRYFVFQTFFTVILCKLWLVGLKLAARP